jgi:eukaryotic-like serine/threonine-protein kinase
MTDRTGQRLDIYYLLRLLGEGAVGEVYLAEHMHQHSYAALKVLTLHLDEETIETFLHEARALFLLKHPSIVPLLDFGVDHKIPFLVMEYAPNGTLHQRHRSGERVALEVVVAYVQQVASALQYAHDQSLIHRDIKPQNMLIGSQGQLLLSDFGVATLVHSQLSLATREMLGTVPYMAPEQIRGRLHKATDQYALGICAYEWLCGVRPFTGSTWEVMTRHVSTPPAPLRSHVPNVPARVEEVVLRALAKEPEERFAKIADFADALWQASQAATSHPGALAPGEPLASHSSPVHSPEDSEFSQVPTLPLPSSEEAPNEASNTNTIIFSLLPSQPVVAPEDLFRTEISTQPQRPPSEENFTTRSYVPSQEISPQPAPEPLSQAKTLWDSRSKAVISPPISVTLQPRGRSKLWRWLLAVGVIVVILGNVSVLVWINNNQRIASLRAAAEVRATVAAPMYQDWTDKHGIMFGFDAAHTHTNPWEQALSVGNVANLHVLWSYTTRDTIKSSLTVANGLVYAGSDDDQLYVFNANCQANCQTLWSYNTSSWMRSSPAVANGMVYIGANNDKFYAFDATCHQGCQPLWSYTTGGGIDSSPVVADGKVFVGSWDNTLYAFNATCHQDCLPLWFYTARGGIFSSPAVANGLVYVGSVDRNLYAFDSSCSENCLPLWSYSTGGAVYSSPSIANGIVYVGSDDGKLYAFDASCRKNCLPLWSYATGNKVESSPAIANGLVYLTSSNGKSYAFDANCRANCRPLWSYTTGGITYSSPTVANGVLYIGGGDYNVYAFDASCRQSCQPLWSYKTGDAVLSSPTVANGVLYVGSADHTLYAFGL